LGTLAYQGYLKEFMKKGFGAFQKKESLEKKVEDAMAAKTQADDEAAEAQTEADKAAAAAAAQAAAAAAAAEADKQAKEEAAARAAEAARAAKKEARVAADKARKAEEAEKAAKEALEKNERDRDAFASALLEKNPPSPGQSFDQWLSSLRKNVKLQPNVGVDPSVESRTKELFDNIKTKKAQEKTRTWKEFLSLVSWYVI
jgi:membrane protein involved in colicin uptake